MRWGGLAGLCCQQEWPPALRLVSFGKAQLFAATYSISCAGRISGIFSVRDPLSPSSIPLCPCVVSLGLGLQIGKMMGDPLVFSQLCGSLLVFLTWVYQCNSQMSSLPWFH